MKKTIKFYATHLSFAVKVVMNYDTLYGKIFKGLFHKFSYIHFFQDIFMYLLLWEQFLLF